MNLYKISDSRKFSLTDLQSELPECVNTLRKCINAIDTCMLLSNELRKVLSSTDAKVTFIRNFIFSDKKPCSTIHFNSLNKDFKFFNVDSYKSLRDILSEFPDLDSNVSKVFTDYYLESANLSELNNSFDKVRVIFSKFFLEDNGDNCIRGTQAEAQRIVFEAGDNRYTSITLAYDYFKFQFYDFSFKYLTPIPYSTAFEKLESAVDIHAKLKEMNSSVDNAKRWIEEGNPVYYQRGFAWKGGSCLTLTKEQALDRLSTIKNLSSSNYSDCGFEFNGSSIDLMFHSYSNGDYD